MITDPIVSLYRADIARCKQDTLETQILLLELAAKREGTERDELLTVAAELGELVKRYDTMKEPSERQRRYWEVMQYFNTVL